MTPEEAYQKAFEIILNNTTGGEYEPQDGHYELDELLCEVLLSLGYDRLVGIYKAQTRWFE